VREKLLTVAITGAILSAMAGALLLAAYSLRLFLLSLRA
jgi:hypothetical protein